MLRLTQSQWFAVEMAQAVLRNRRHRFFKKMGLGQIWDDVDITPDPENPRIINLKIHIRGFNRRVWVKCVVALDRIGEFDHGECYVELRGKEPYNECCTCIYANGEMRHFYGIHGLWNLGLDDDLLADLKAESILMEAELRNLTEEQVWDIMFKGAGSLEPTFDKLDRLYAVLEEKNIRLEGPRHRREELLAML